MTKIIGAVAAAVLSLSASSALAATLTNVSVTLSNNAPSQPTAITAKHTIAAPLDTNEFILRYALPAGFTKIVNVHQGDCTGVTLKIDGIAQTAGNAPSCSVSTNGSVWISTIVPVSNGSEVEVHVDASLYSTPSTPGVKTFTMYQTADAGGSELDGAVPMPTVTIAAPPPPASVPTMTEWAMILLTAALGGFAALTIQKRRRTV